ncbi:UvrB/UvrC motif-containing protein [Candidatus Parcubacteria bacterium]|nr:UvrB/UvrC motif-containing protein [Candidatus Parcubacteria bacterium]
MKLPDLKQFNLPDAPGVYFFLASKKASKLRSSEASILYIGKATSLKDRVKSYFSKDIFLSRGPRIVKMLEEANSIEFVQTDSVLEALILEANEIKKHQPIYNAREKDDKSYLYVTLTKEEFPKVVITRGSGDFGPFPHSGELKAALKIIRKIFPYRDEKCKIVPGKLKPCFNAQIGLCPGPCAGRISKSDYRKQVRNIKLFFEGKKETLIKTLEKEMNVYAKNQEFEKAEGIKKKIFSLNHIQDIALIKKDLSYEANEAGEAFRIEAYDIAHISGTNVVGVMTVVEDEEVNKSQYRKFKIKLDKNDDTKNLREIISRRFGHPEWRFPNMIVVDGGKGQINAARAELDKMGLEMIKVVSVVKDDRHKAKQILGDLAVGQLSLEKAIILANAEAHRFAINYHRLLRSKGFRI